MRSDMNRTVGDAVGLGAPAKGAEMRRVRRKSWWLTTGVAIGFYIGVRMAQRGKELEEEESDEYDDEYVD